MPCTHPGQEHTWLTIEEAADYIKVHRTTLQKYIRSGALKVSRPSERVVRICAEELNAYMDGVRNGS